MTHTVTERPVAQHTRPTPATNSAESQVVLLGATITGNRGAESMLRAAVQRIPEFEPGVRFTLLSLYPKDDIAENRDPAIRIVPLAPVHLVFVAFPLALLAGLLARLRLPHKFLLRTPALRAIHDTDLVIDLSGISFVEGRGLVLLYNVLVVLIPVLLKTPAMKYAQALGPFRGKLNSWAARWLLPKVARIAARGRITREHLDGLALPPEIVESCSDAAFAMQVGPQAQQTIAPLLTQPTFARPVVCVSASSVVEKLCRRHGVDYPRQIAAFIDYLIDQKGYGVCLLAHSARPGRKSAKNNDLPVCRRIAELVNRPECLLPELTLDAEALRVLIGKCRFLVASRFHAMISGLATGVPTMLVGWSHKYAEVLEMFDLEKYALDYAELSEDALRQLFERLEREEEDVRRRIQQHLPAVVEASLKNARLAADLLVRCRRPATAGRGSAEPHA
ncbi:MAG: polysaccharide pyruvyl transferase family protein [Planctomycetes bacterium]|nr:polysaccharide pyruvyl transferase family protein [Planctomycetota bacterium]